MSSRFDLADALVQWARKRRKEMAQYQHDSIRAQRATTDYRIAIKEVLDQLRSALDYCAREICERSSGTALPADAKVYFPIVAKGFQKADFHSRVGKLMPGVLGTREDLVGVLESFQEFSCPLRNGWLPDFSTLCNENKHDQLSFQRNVLSLGQIGQLEGKPVYSTRRRDNVPMLKGCMMAVTKRSPPKQLRGHVLPL